MATLGDPRSRRLRRLSNDSASSISTSPERKLDDDAESFVSDDNESVSSVTPSDVAEELDDSEARAAQEQNRVSPISRLPTEIMLAIFGRLSVAMDLRSCMLVSRGWAKNSVQLLWHRPHTSHWEALHHVVQSIRNPNTYFDYYNLVKRLNLSALGNQVSDGTLLPFAACKRIERLTLTNCNKLTDLSVVRMLEGNRSLLALDITSLDGVTDATMHAVAANCMRLQGLNITNCRKITDSSLEHVANNCRYVKRLKFNGCHTLTDRSIIAFARHCRSILEIDLADCRNIEDDAVTALINEGHQLRELRLAHCGRITDAAFLNLPQEITFESLRILDLTDCGELQDAGVQKIVQAAPRLRNLVLSKCKQITDIAVMAITKLGKNLHYIHLGHCQRITDTGVQQLVKLCNRIRYIDLACCSNLTDTSVQQLASLPKLKRIGLVKCGNITDRSIYALARPRNTYPFQNAAAGPSSLERVHLSYCTLLSLNGIHALLNNCPKLTHLSLTGVQAFLREDLLVHCRKAPPEFNEHQRDVFCVFSGKGVEKLRDQLNVDPQHHHQLDGEGSMYDEDQVTPSFEHGGHVQMFADFNNPTAQLVQHGTIGATASSWPGATVQAVQVATPQQNHSDVIPPPPPPHFQLQNGTGVLHYGVVGSSANAPGSHPNPGSGEVEMPLTFNTLFPPNPLDGSVVPMFLADNAQPLQNYIHQNIQANAEQFQQLNLTSPAGSEAAGEPQSMDTDPPLHSQY